jgi:hypothetical protein
VNATYNAGGDNFAALDFGDEAGYDSAGDEWAFDAVPVDEPAAPEAPAEDEFSWERTTVTNPTETVSVTALMDGKTLGVELGAGAASMTESELAAEILVMSGLATQRASSVLHTLLIGSMQAQGLLGDGALAERLGTRFLGLTSQQQADQAQAEVFATRYPQQH